MNRRTQEHQEIREPKSLRLPYFLVLGFSVTSSATVLTAQQDCADSSSARHVSFEEMRVRLYGDIAIVNGTTITRNANGALVRRVRFSDVFQKRNGRWQAINLQETLLEGSLD